MAYTALELLSAIPTRCKNHCVWLMCKSLDVLLQDELLTWPSQLRTSQPSILAIQVGHIPHFLQMINTAAQAEFLWAKWTKERTVMMQLVSNDFYLPEDNNGIEHNSTRRSLLITRFILHAFSSWNHSFVLPIRNIKFNTLWRLFFLWILT